MDRYADGRLKALSCDKCQGFAEGEEKENCEKLFGSDIYAASKFLSDPETRYLDYLGALGYEAKGEKAAAKK